MRTERHDQTNTRFSQNLRTGQIRRPKTPVKLVKIRIISNTHWGVVRLRWSSENRKCFTPSFGCLKLLFRQDEQNTDHETELVGTDGNYSGFCFEGDRFECQSKHGLFWNVFMYIQHISDGNVNQATTDFVFNITRIYFYWQSYHWKPHILAHWHDNFFQTFTINDC